MDEETKPSVTRYVLCPGWIESRTDGNLHYISAGQLAQLYGVSIKESAVIHLGKPQNRGWKKKPGDVLLEPRYDGKYRRVIRD